VDCQFPGGDLELMDVSYRFDRGVRADEIVMSCLCSFLSVHLSVEGRVCWIQADRAGWALHFVKEAGNTKVSDTVVFIFTFVSIMPLG
jgi:hypothetical protein